jgi:hypothetical protein
LNISLARSSAATGVRRASVAHSPRPREDINLLLVFGILSFTVDGTDLDEHVYCQ